MQLPGVTGCSDLPSASPNPEYQAGRQWVKSLVWHSQGSNPHSSSLRADTQCLTTILYFISLLHHWAEELHTCLYAHVLEGSVAVWVMRRTVVFPTAVRGPAATSGPLTWTYIAWTPGSTILLRHMHTHTHTQKVVVLIWRCRYTLPLLSTTGTWNPPALIMGLFSLSWTDVCMLSHSTGYWKRGRRQGVKPYSGYPRHLASVFPPDDGETFFFPDHGPTSSSGEVLLLHSPSTCRLDSFSSSTALPLSIPLGGKRGIK